MEPTRAVLKCYASQWMRMVVQHWWSRKPPVSRGFWAFSWPPRLPCIKSATSAMSRSTLRSSCTYSLRSFCVTSQSRLCWRCQAEMSRAELFCPTCTSLQPPDESKDFFQVLDCEKSFNVDTQELQRKYRNLQRLLHPDFFSQKSESERNISEKQSTVVNKAYKTLLSPLKRGVYLLSLNGITLKEGADDEVDTQFLFDILELNEQLNDAETKDDIEEVGHFVQGDLQEAKILLAKMKYFSNIQDQVKKKIIP
uniref:HscB mitochondrial iron-sulfur cluster co-chaperone n=1 Tax=Xenopus tropicalis TaxID=8364 RepID=A0A6I8RX69_XENTR